MLTEALTALGAAGGTAVVGAMATDAWQAARDHVARLFDRSDASRLEAIEAVLDGDADILIGADEADRESVRQELAAVWRRRMVRLLDQHPDAAPDLEELITAIRLRLSPEQQGWVQHNTATAGGTVIAHQGTGSQHIHYDQSPSDQGSLDPDAGEDSSMLLPGDGR